MQIIVYLLWIFVFIAWAWAFDAHRRCIAYSRTLKGRDRLVALSYCQWWLNWMLRTGFVLAALTVIILIG